MKTRKINYKANSVWSGKNSLSGTKIVMDPTELNWFLKGLDWLQSYDSFKDYLKSLTDIASKIRPYEDKETPDEYGEGSVSSIVYENEIPRLVLEFMAIIHEIGIITSTTNTMVRLPDFDQNIRFLKVAGKSVPLLVMPEDGDKVMEFDDANDND